MHSRLTLAAVLLTALTSLAAEPLRLHPDNPRYLLFRGKPAVLITSGEHYGAVMNLDFDYVKYLDELKRANLNLTRTFSGTYREIPDSFGITDNTLSPKRYIGPWARTDTPGAKDGKKFDLTRWDDAYFARLKNFVGQAGERGVVVEMVLFCTLYNEALWDINPMNGKNNVNGIGAVPRSQVYNLQHKDLQEAQEDFVRKIVTELNGFDNVYFEICNEPYFEVVTAQWSDRIAQVIAETEAKLPNRHLIAQNIANGNKKIEKPNPAVSIFNFHYATPPDCVANNWALNKVIANDETGFRGKDDALYRTEGWEFVIAGGAIYSSLDYSFTPGHPAGTLRDYKSPGGGSRELRDQLGILRSFMEGFDFIRMAPRNQLITGGTATTPLSGNPAKGEGVTIRCLAREGEAYAIYIRGGTSARFNLELPRGRYSAEWINTRTGAVEKPEKFDHAGGARPMTTPDYTQDIALRVVKAE